MQKKALITGVTGQDGAYLAKYLLEKTDFLCYFYKFEKLLNIIDMEMIYGTEILLSGKNRKRVQQPH